MLHLRRPIVAGLLLFGLTALSAYAKPNFTGSWKLNSAKSEFGQFPAPASMTQKATHEDPSLKVATKMATDNGDFDFESTYSTDGKETTNTFGPNPMKSVAKWEGDTLTIQTKGQFGDGEITIQDKWDLSEDGKTLTMRRHFASSQGEMDQKYVLEKQ
ncbi:MAG TPA: hypothetical protein VGK29_26225 [Paludibaculum sp.]|jgi:hypothetical protein